jgi:hypothetical protein
MKSKINILLASLFAALFLSSCGADYYDRVISNHIEGTTVWYVYDRKIETLGPGASKAYSVTLAVKAPSSVVFVPAPHIRKALL